jgi:hypothetical protein
VSGHLVVASGQQHRTLKSALLGAGFSLFATLSSFVAPAIAAPGDQDSLLLQLDAARRMVKEAGAALDSLRHDLANHSGTAASPTYGLALSAEDSVIWREVRAEKRRREVLAKAFDNRRASLGYIFNPNLILGMNAIAWQGDFGLKADGRVSLVERRRALGGNLSLLYAIHEFYITEEQMFTRLYLFSGGGYYWERRYDANGNWFDTPDRAWRGQFGAGTELGLREAHGTRFTPEIGFQGSSFRSRYTDSPDYSGDRPSSRYSLYPYYALHFNFYFL